MNGQLISNLPRSRFLDVTQKTAARETSPFPSQYEFHFKPKLTIQMSQTLNIIDKGDVFSAKPLGKSLFLCQNVWSGHGPAGQF